MVQRVETSVPALVPDGSSGMAPACCPRTSNFPPWESVFSAAHQGAVLFAVESMMWWEEERLYSHRHGSASEAWPGQGSRVRLDMAHSF